jgi:hypothetical protein
MPVFNAVAFTVDFLFFPALRTNAQCTEITMARLGKVNAQALATSAPTADTSVSVERIDYHKAIQRSGARSWCHLWEMPVTGHLLHDSEQVTAGAATGCGSATINEIVL